MREILFRGKCQDTGRWYEGQYIHLHKTTYCFKEDYDRDKDNDIHQIVFERMTDWNLPNQHLRVDVIPETVGQYTGLTDKNGKKIFEGDIVKYTEFHKFSDDEDLESAEEKSERISVVKFAYGKFTPLPIRYNCEDSWYSYATDNFEIIGNIHDNPELLKGGD